MARIPDLRTIKKEDFDSKDQKLVEKLAFPFNNFMQQVVNVLKNGVDFTNLNQFYTTITVTVDATGKPTTDVQFKNSLTTKVAGVICISYTNQSGVLRFPTAQPGISYTITSDNFILINNISGLPVPPGNTNSDSYSLTILVIGQNIATA